jgi:hypothetical protein
LEDRLVPAVDTWTGLSASMGGSAGWSNAGNWSLGTPGTGDTANFTNNSSVKFFTSDVDAAFMVAGVTIDSSWGGTINVNMNLTVTGNFTLASGTVDGNGLLTMGGNGSQWSAGTLSPGTGGFSNSGTLTFSNGAALSLTSGTLTNNGLIDQSGTADLSLNFGGKLNNAGTYNITTDTNIVTGQFGTNVFTNTGTLKKTGGTGTSTISPGFQSSAKITVTSGTLSLTGGTITGGTFTVKTGAVLDLASNSSFVTYGGSFTGSGAGTVALRDGTIDVPSGGATFNFPAGLFQWSGGTIDATHGTLTNAATGIMTLSNASGVSLNSGSLINNGIINQSGTADLSLNFGGMMNNAGTYNITTDTNIVTGQFGTNVFTNSGTLEKTGGTGTSTISPGFNNSANITVTSGTLGLTGGTITGGNFTVSAGAVLDLASNSSFVTYGGSYTGSGAGTVALRGGAIDVASGGATFSFPAGLFQWSGGTIDAANGTLTNAVTGVMTLSNASGVSLNSGSLINKGIINQSGTANLSLNFGGMLSNAGTYNITTDTSVVGGPGGPNVFTNTGTLEKAGGTGTSMITLNSSANITVTSGTLGLAGGTMTGGTFTVSAGAVLDLTGGDSFGVTYGGSFTGSGAGTVALKSGLLGVASGGATFNFPAGLFQWSGGNIDASNSTLTNAATGVMTLANADGVSLNNGSLINDGVINQSGAASVQLNEGGTLFNAGTYNFTTDTGINVGLGGPNTFTNTGTLEKTGGTGTTAFACPLDSTGTVEVRTGIMNISGGVTQVSGNALIAGSWTVDGSSTVQSTLEISSAGSITTIGSKARITLNGVNTAFTNINGAGGLNTILAGGRFTIAAMQTFTTAGNLSNAGSVILRRSTLNITGAVAQLSGNTLTGGTWKVGAHSNLNFPAGANITSLAGAKVTLSGGHSNFAALANLATVGRTSSFSVLGGRSFTTVGGFTNSGKLTIGAGSALIVSGSFTETSLGRLTLAMGLVSGVPAVGNIISTSGSVTLGGSLTVTSTVVPAVGSSFEIVNNEGSDADSGTFTGLPEGATFTVQVGLVVMTFEISYLGGSGNDVVITRVA